MTHDFSATQSTAIVEEALACEHDEAGTLIARFTTAGELDHFSRRYNVNDGFERAAQRAASPRMRCRHSPVHLDDPQARADTDSQPARWNAHALLADIEQRYPHGFHHHRIACDPAAECALALGADYVQGIRTRHAGSPSMQPLLPIADAP